MARAATRPGHLLPAWLPPPLLDVACSSTPPPGTPSHSLSTPSPSSALSLAQPERSSSPPLAVAAPRASPSTLGVPSSSATSPSSSPTSQATSDALHRRHRAVFFTHGRRMPLVDSPSPPPPRAHRAARRPRRELLCRTPLSPCSISLRSHRYHRGRELLAAGHGVAVATATASRSRAHRRAHRNLRSPQHPPVSPVAHHSVESIGARTLAPPRARFRRAPATTAAAAR